MTTIHMHILLYTSQRLLLLIEDFLIIGLQLLMPESRPFSFCLGHLYLLGLPLVLLLGLLLFVILVHLHHHCKEDQDHTYPLQVIDLMTKMEDIDNYCKALPGGYDEGWNVLLEHLDHPIDN